MRSVEEWIGKDDDAIPPPRVRLRVFEKNNGCCHLCSRRISAAEYWQCDHVIALVNGGANAESNLRPACQNCCYRKTAEDVAEKSKIARKRSKHLGVTKTRRPFRKPPPGYNAWTRRIET